MTKEELIKYFEYFSNGDPSCDGFESLLSVNGKQEVFQRLMDRSNLDLSLIELNVLFAQAGIASISEGFFNFYWLTLQDNHPYNLKELELGYSKVDDNEEELLITIGGYEKDGIENYFELDSLDSKKTNAFTINRIEHLRWGFLRIYTDALLYFGNITVGFNELSKKSEIELIDFFGKRKFDAKHLGGSNVKIEFNTIDKNDRFLISEAVCKNLDASDATKTALRIKLLERYREAVAIGKTNVKVGVLLDNDAKLHDYKDVSSAKAAKENKEIKLSMEDEVSTSEFIERYITKESDIDEIIVPLYDRFLIARRAAVENTRLFLSYLHDVDIYVATSMRGKDDFLKMTDTCNEIFHDSNPPNLKELQLLYFDPTISAAEGHDDKGLIECLMVHCAKVLIYTSGAADSYGKDAEAAMALSSGKPVIFYCPDDIRYKISKDIHPLTKLIDFNTGVANGAMVAKNLAEVKTLLSRLFNNKMRYMLTNEKIIMDGETPVEKAYFKLKDTQTTSTVRVQTSDLFLAKCFWNYFTKYTNSRNSEI